MGDTQIRGHAFLGPPATNLNASTVKAVMLFHAERFYSERIKNIETLVI